MSHPSRILAVLVAFTVPTLTVTALTASAESPLVSAPFEHRALSGRTDDARVDYYDDEPESSSGTFDVSGSDAWRKSTLAKASKQIDALIDADDRGIEPGDANVVTRWIGVKPGDAKYRSALETLKSRFGDNHGASGIGVVVPPAADTWSGCAAGYNAEYKDDTIYMCRPAFKSKECTNTVLTHEYFHAIGMPAEGTQGVETEGKCSPPGDVDAALRSSSCLTGVACELVHGKGKSCSSPCSQA